MKKEKKQEIGTVRKVIRNTGGGLFFASAGTALCLGMANQIITWGKLESDFTYPISSLEGGFAWDAVAYSAIWGCIMLMIIGLGIYGATLRENE